MLTIAGGVILAAAIVFIGFPVLVGILFLIGHILGKILGVFFD